MLKELKLCVVLFCAAAFQSSLCSLFFLLLWNFERHTYSQTHVHNTPIEWTPSNLATLGSESVVMIRGVESFQDWSCTTQWTSFNLATLGIRQCPH